LVRPPQIPGINPRPGIIVDPFGHHKCVFGMILR
jgi:hypothetical protein